MFRRRCGCASSSRAVLIFQRLSAISESREIILLVISNGGAYSDTKTPSFLNYIIQFIEEKVNILDVILPVILDVHFFPNSSLTPTRSKNTAKSVRSSSLSAAPAMYEPKNTPGTPKITEARALRHLT